MKRKLIPAVALALLAMTVTSCGGGASEWTYKDGLADGELGYVILVGEQGNPEAEDRTKGVKDALAEAVKTMYNPVTGEKGGITLKNYGELICKKGTEVWSGEGAKDLLTPILSKHKGKIDFIGSNNDGMAVAVSSLNNLPKYTPIVGFDALTDACKMIKAGTLAGSVTQNGDDQALAALTIAAEVIKGNDPMKTINDEFKGNAELVVNGEGLNNVVQTKISAVTAENADKFKPGAYVGVDKLEALKGKKVLVTYYNSADNFIQETYRKALTHYSEALGFEYKEINGVKGGEAEMKTAISAAENTNNGKFDAYLFNIIEHTSYADYLNGRTDKPIVFFNRQPKNTAGTINDLSTLGDHVYFVGTAAGGQGKAQGEVVKNYFAKFDANNLTH